MKPAYILFAAILLSACSESDDETTPDIGMDSIAIPSEIYIYDKPKKLTQPKIKPEVARFKAIEWTDLMPKDDLDALLSPPTYITDVEDGSLEDEISSQLLNTSAKTDDRYQQALVSKRIMTEMNGQEIRLPGFVVPLEYDDKQLITQFFLVPYFGACIHVPPPPPNQIVFVKYSKGLKQDTLYDPIWIAGELKTSLVENEMATAAYSMEMQHFDIYIEPY